MTGELIKICALALGIAAPNALLALDCVEDVDEKITFSESGVLHKVNRIVDYMALISRRDLHNSSGVRLANFAAVMQQDRANLHKSGTSDIVGEFMDTRDDYFTTRKRREILSTARYYSDCTLTRSGVAAMQADILNAGGLGIVWVVVFQHPDGKPAVYISQVN